MKSGLEVRIPQKSNVYIDGDLTVPDNALGVVVFSHGSGSGRFSPRNRQVAEIFQQHRIATLLMDLLTVEEELIDVKTGDFRFDINLLTNRLLGTIDWLPTIPSVAELPLCCFGSSTGAAAALSAAAQRPDLVNSVISRGGRPDLTDEDLLTKVRAPTLFIVGGHDEITLDLNQQAAKELPTETRIETIPGATHLFEEPGALERVADLATDWFLTHL